MERKKIDAAVRTTERVCFVVVTGAATAACMALDKARSLWFAAGIVLGIAAMSVVMAANLGAIFIARAADDGGAE